MAGPLKIAFDSLPDALKPFVSRLPKTDTRGDGLVAEPTYYRAFNDMLAQADLDESTHRRLVVFHVANQMSAWAIDHDAHAKHCYYPSNAFPLGSTAEYTFFARNWAKNVNRPYVERVYGRRGAFREILRHVDGCPCRFVYAFNVRGASVYPEDARGGEPPLCKLSLENELMMRSEFFTRRKHLFTAFNRWLYDRVVAQLLDRPAEQASVELRVGERVVRINVSDRVWRRHARYDVRVRKRADSVAEVRAQRRTRALDPVLRRLYFGAERGGRRDTLLRCEDPTSFLYCALLRRTACRHEDETVRYEQRRCGDEIATEIRTCKSCGAVRAN